MGIRKTDMVIRPQIAPLPDGSGIKRSISYFYTSRFRANVVTFPQPPFPSFRARVAGWLALSSRHVMTESRDRKGSGRGRGEQSSRKVSRT